ncbi:unnamed protein product [Polarella glacialis]|uniref:Uncharacterized protein n=1 Tax=Polarella glacialis TaxID=89957 RepID=A0A813EJB6_POLGL|nr:unnamed protein product [Polarella glacialis]
MDGIAGKLECRWHELCETLGVSSEDRDLWWKTLRDRHGEAQRAYHTLSHLEEMFGYFDVHLASITDTAAVSLAIFFHDAVYDPRAGSPQNELDIWLFLVCFNNSNNNKMGLHTQSFYY